MTELQLLNRIADRRGVFTARDGGLDTVRDELQRFVFLGYILRVRPHEGRYRGKLVLDRVDALGELTPEGEARRQELLRGGAA